MNIDDYSRYTIAKISEGYVPGGYQKLKETYPKAFNEIEEQLAKKFDKEGLDTYRERLVAGLKKIGYYKD